MSKVSWSQPTSWTEVQKRASGRRHVNAVRRLRAKIRRGQVMELLHAGGWRHGVQARIAKALVVSESTISRDLAVILPLYTDCPTCGGLRPRLWAEDD